MTDADAAPPVHPGAHMKPHRGAMVLTLGIVSIVFSSACGFILGIVAWVIANGDLREMDAGRMDPEGRGLTQAGKICGIISVGLAAFGLLIGLLWVVLFIAIGIGGAAAGAAGAGP